MVGSTAFSNTKIHKWVFAVRAAKRGRNNGVVVCRDSTVYWSVKVFMTIHNSSNHKRS